MLLELPGDYKQFHYSGFYREKIPHCLNAHCILTNLINLPQDSELLITNFYCVFFFSSETNPNKPTNISLSKTDRKITYKQFQEAVNLMAAIKYPGDKDAAAKLEEKITQGKGPKAVNATVGK